MCAALCVAAPALPWFGVHGVQSFDQIDDPARLRRLVQAILILDAELHLPVVLRVAGHRAWHRPAWLDRVLPRVTFSH